MEELEPVKKINCYQCKKETDKNDFFPFCCSECKEEWNKGKEQPTRRVPKTIKEMQSRLMEMALAVKNKNNNQLEKIGGGEILTNQEQAEKTAQIAFSIFGS